MNFVFSFSFTADCSLSVLPTDNTARLRKISIREKPFRQKMQL